MALKKSELYSSLWKSCDELRGGMDASQYKDYVLVLLFVKYVSDKYAGQTGCPARRARKGGSFADMVAAKGDKEIGDKINKIIGRLAEANDSLKGVINVADFNDEEKLGSGKEMVDRLTKLVAIFEGLDFGRNRAEGDDLLGRRLRVPDAPLRHRVGQEQGAVLHPGRGLPRHVHGDRPGQGRPCGPEHLRPHLRLRLAAAQGARRSQEPHRAGPRALRPGDGQRHQRAGADEHGAARLPHGGDLAGQHARRAALQESRRAAQDLRLRGGQFPVLQQGVEQRPRPGQRPLWPLRVRHPAQEERRLRLPAAHPRRASRAPARAR